MFPPPTQSAAVLLKNTTDLIKLFDICPDMSISIINLNFTSQFQFRRGFFTPIISSVNYVFFLKIFLFDKIPNIWFRLPAPADK